MVSIEPSKKNSSKEYLFENLNIKIKKNSTNAIVGPSGFGKTTMLFLIYRMYDPHLGNIYIDG